MEDTNMPETIIPKDETTFVPEKPDLAQVDATTEALSKKKKQVPAYVWAILAVLVLVGLGALGYYLAVLQKEDTEDQTIEEEETVCENLDQEYIEDGNLLVINYSSEVFSGVEMVNIIEGIRGFKLLNSDEYLYLVDAFETKELLTAETKMDVSDRIYTCNDRIGYIVELEDGSERIVLRQEVWYVGDQVITSGFNKEYHFYCSEGVEDCASLVETISINFGDTEESLAEIVPTVDTSDWKTWTGDYLSAKLPEDWSAEETSNTENWNGLVEFVVKNENGVVFGLQYNSGLGGYPTCESTFIKFSDYSPEQLQSFMDVYNNDVAEGSYDCPSDPQIEDFGDDYVSVDFLSNEFRRPAKWYYIDSVSDNAYFEYDLVAGNLVNTPLGQFLYYTWTEGLTGNDMLVLDQVLESIDVVNESPTEYVSDEITGKTDSWDDMTDYEQQQYIVQVMEDAWVDAGFELTESGLGNAETDNFNYVDMFDDATVKSAEGYRIGLDGSSTLNEYTKIVSYFQNSGFESIEVTRDERIQETQFKKDDTFCYLKKYLSNDAEFNQMYLRCTNKASSSSPEVNIPTFYENFIIESTLGYFQYNEETESIQSGATYPFEADYVEELLSIFDFIFDESKSTQNSYYFDNYYTKGSVTCRVLYSEENRIDVDCRDFGSF